MTRSSTVRSRARLRGRGGLSSCMRVVVAWLVLWLGGMAGCGERRECVELVQALCTGQSPETCRRIELWLAQRMQAVDGSTLAPPQADVACGTILRNTAARERYREAALTAVVAPGYEPR